MGSGYNTTKDVDLANEHAYLSGLVAQGGGNAQWAKEQADIYGLDLSKPFSISDSLMGIQTTQQSTVGATTVSAGGGNQNVTTNTPGATNTGLLDTAQDYVTDFMKWLFSPIKTLWEKLGGAFNNVIDKASSSIIYWIPIAIAGWVIFNLFKAFFKVKAGPFSAGVGDV